MIEAVDQVASFFEGSAFAMAIKALRSYYSPLGCFTGAAFDRFAAESPAERYTAQDMLAVTMLAVEVPPRAALWLIDQDDLIPNPAIVPQDASLWDLAHLLDPSGPCWDWSIAVRGCRGIGRTTASKLLAVKRPGLIPIYDTHVAAALRIGQSEWAFWQAVAIHENSGELRGLVGEVRVEAGVPDHVTDLRAIDIVVWMRQHGWRTHAGDGCSFCDYEGFAV